MWFNHVLRNRTSRPAALAEGGGDGRRAGAGDRQHSGGRAEPAAPTDLRITHVWHEGETPRTFTRLIPASRRRSSYEVTAAEGVINDEVRIEGVAQ